MCGSAFSFEGAELCSRGKAQPSRNAGLAVINAAGVYAQLVAAHVGERGAAQAALSSSEAALEARISVQAHTVADLDRRLAQIDAAVEKATEKGRTTAAMKLADDQRKARAGLVDERKREAGTLWAALQAERAGVVSKGRQIETEAAPIRYVAELLGVIRTASAQSDG